MRGHVSGQGPMFMMINIEDKVPADHPLRAVKRRCDRILADVRRLLAGGDDEGGLDRLWRASPGLFRPGSGDPGAASQ